MGGGTRTGRYGYKGGTSVRGGHFSVAYCTRVEPAGDKAQLVLHVENLGEEVARMCEECDFKVEDVLFGLVGLEAVWIQMLQNSPVLLAHRRRHLSDLNNILNV